MNSPHGGAAVEPDVEDVEDVNLFQEFIDNKSQSVRDVDSDVCPICFEPVQDTQVSACVRCYYTHILQYSVTAA